MSLQDLFGSDSEEEEQDEGSIDAEDLPSTQAHMQELFGDSDDYDEADSQQGQQKRSTVTDEDQVTSDEGSLETENKDVRSKVQHGSDDEPELDFGDEDSNNRNDVDRRTRHGNGSHEDSGGEFDSAEGNEEQDVSTSDFNASKPIPTHEDLFGEDVDVSSDEEEEDGREPTLAEGAFGDAQTQDQILQEQEEEDEGVSIEIELPRCNMGLSKELYFVKLPNFLSVETKPFDPNFYEDEIDEDEVLDEEGRARLKLRVENTMRWRYAKDKDGNEIKESNARVVKWSDGSMSLHLGNEIFDIFKMPIQGKQNHLFVQQGTGLQAQAVFRNKLSFRPHSTASQTHRKMTMSIAERMSKAQKIRIVPATEKDPIYQREELAKAEDERERARMRRESQQRRMREKRQSKGLTANYLEQDMDEEGGKGHGAADEEQDFEDSIAAIKSKYKKDIKRNRGIYSDDDDDEDGESKLRNAKLDIASDDEGDGAKKAAKKASKKIIEESDEDSG